MLYVDLLAVVKRIGRIENDPLVGTEAIENFESGAVVAANGDALQVSFVIGVDDYSAETLRPKKQRVHGNA